jgi:hypothetical protein
MRTVKYTNRFHRDYKREKSGGIGDASTQNYSKR